MMTNDFTIYDVINVELVDELDGGYTLYVTTRQSEIRREIRISLFSYEGQIPLG
jgi:hypothetical protein